MSWLSSLKDRAIALVTKQTSLPLRGRGSGWLPIIRESFAGAFQQNVEIDNNTVVTHPAVFACITLIAGDISKLYPCLKERTPDGVWVETSNAAYSPVLRKPNNYQTRNQFWESWMLSKLSSGNTYVLKQRDQRGVVNALYILDPLRVQPLVAGDGSVFYRLNSDEISGLLHDIIVPANEIIHDRWNTFFHPLIGMSPITAAALSATQALNIQFDSAFFFKNNSVPGGILTAPGTIDDVTAKRLKESWQENYGGKNSGKLAVLGDGLKFEQMRATARDSQLIEQLKWTSEVVCSVFHVPSFKIGLGQTPAYNNIQALNLEYYNSALQVLIEAAEVALDEGLSISANLGVEFDLDGLLRMDTKSQIEASKMAVDGGFMKPNEARRKIDLLPVEGGDTPYMQQQNWSLAQLAQRPAPSALPGASPPDEIEPAVDEDEDAQQDTAEDTAQDIEEQLLIEIAKYETAQVATL